MEKVASLVISTVVPSGAAFATVSAARIVFAPGLFSTSTGWPQSRDSFSAICRAITSMPPPGG